MFFLRGPNLDRSGHSGKKRVLAQGTKRQNLEARVLQKLQPQVVQRSGIDRYFDERVVIVENQ